MGQIKKLKDCFNSQRQIEQDRKKKKMISKVLIDFDVSHEEFMKNKIILR